MAGLFAQSAGLFSKTPVGDSGVSQVAAEQAFKPISFGMGSVANSTPNNLGGPPTDETLGSLGFKAAMMPADILRMIPRGILSLGLTLAPQSVRDSIGAINPEKDFGPYGPALIGKDPINSLQSDTAEFNTKHPSVPLPLVALGMSAGEVLNLLPFGGEANAFKEITAANDLRTAANIGRKLGIHPDLIDSFARGALDVKDPVAAKAFVDSYAHLQATTIAKGKGIFTRAGGAAVFDSSKYLSDLQAAQKEARGTSGGFKATVSNFLKDAKAKLVDFTAPIEDTLNAAIKAHYGESAKVHFAPSFDIHNQIDRVLRAPTMAGQFAKDHGIVDVIRNVDNIHHFDQYLIAQHAIDLAGRGVVTGRDLAKDQALVDTLSAKYGPAAAQINKYTQALLDKSVADGLISKALADALKARYPHYVPFHRIFTAIEQTADHTTVGGIASLSRQTVVRGIEGSTRQIESPITSLLARTYDVFKQGEKNVAGRMLAGYEHILGNPFELKELKAGESAPHTISFLDNGVKRTFSTTKEIAAAAKALNVQQLGILGQIFALPTRIGRIGITGINLPFLGANLVKDQVTAFINADHALRTSLLNPKVFTQALFAAVGHGDLYEEMVRAGGAGTSFDISRNQVQSTISSIRAGRSVPTKILYTVTHPGALLRAVEDIVARGEEMTRLQQYKGTKDALLSKGLPENESIVGGARAARDSTVNFARRGEYGSALNAAFLYLNAGIQGTRTLLGNLKSKPGQTITKIAVSVMMPVATVTAWNLSDPARKAAYDDIPDYEKQNNLIWIPDNPTKDAKGNWNVVKMPLSQEVNNLAGLARQMMEAAHGANPLTFGEVAQALLGTVSPVNPTPGSIFSTFTPQAFKPTLEGFLNKNIFTGTPEVPDNMKNLSPENQVKPYTSGTARKVGDAIGVSPIKVEDWVKETFGGVGSQALNASDNALSKAGVIPKDQIGGQDILTAVAGRFNKAAGGAGNKAQVDEAQGALTAQTDEKAALKAKAEALDHELSNMSKSEANAKVAALSKTDPLLVQQLVNVVNARTQNLTYEEKIMNQLEVVNGARAKYINTQILKLKTPDERNAYVQALIQKKIITKNVLLQLKQLQNK